MIARLLALRGVLTLKYARINIRSAPCISITECLGYALIAILNKQLILDIGIIE